MLNDDEAKELAAILRESYGWQASTLYNGKCGYLMDGFTAIGPPMKTVLESGIMNDIEAITIAMLNVKMHHCMSELYGRKFDMMEYVWHEWRAELRKLLRKHNLVLCEPEYKANEKTMKDANDRLISYGHPFISPIDGKSYNGYVHPSEFQADRIVPQDSAG